DRPVGEVSNSEYGMRNSECGVRGAADRLWQGVDDLPTGIIIQDSRYERGMNTMPAALRFDSGKQGEAGTGKVADNVDDLVPYKFICEPQAILVHEAALGGQYDRIVETAVSNQPQVPERLDLGFGYEGPGGGHLARELAVRYLDRAALYSDQGVRKIYQ